MKQPAKHFAILFLCSITTLLTAQSTTPPKLRMVRGPQRTDFMIGEKASTVDAVQLHLYQYDPAAGSGWKKSRYQARYAAMYGGIGFVGACAAVYGKNPGWRKAGLVTAIGGFTGTIAFSMASRTNKKRAIKTYNTRFGY